MHFWVLLKTKTKQTKNVQGAEIRIFQLSNLHSGILSIGDGSKLIWEPVPLIVIKDKIFEKYLSFYRMELKF